MGIRAVFCNSAVRSVAAGAGQSRDPLDSRRMAGGLEEFDQIVARHRGGHGVGQRMGVDDGVLHQRRIQHHGNPGLAVVDDAEGRHRARRDAEEFLQQFGRAEGKAPRRAEDAVQALEVDHGVFQRCDQVNRLLFVAQEQVFGVPAGDFAAQRLALFDREQRRVGRGGMGDAKAVEIGEKLVGGGGHRTGRTGGVRGVFATPGGGAGAAINGRFSPIAKPGCIWQRDGSWRPVKPLSANYLTDAGVAQG